MPRFLRNLLMFVLIVIIEHWRNHYNTKRPHSALGYRLPAPEADNGEPLPIRHAATILRSLTALIMLNLNRT